MTPKRLFFGLLASLVVIFAALLASTYVITTLLHTKSAQLATSKARVDQLTSQQTGLAASKRDIAKYAALEAVTKAIVPQDKDQAEAVREITNIASASGVTLTTITFPNSTLGAAAALPTTPGAATVTTPAALTALSQLTKVPTIPGVYTLPITIGNNTNNSVTFDQLEAFLQALENNRRTAEVSSLSIQPQGTNSSQLVFTLAINDYIKPS